MSIQELEAALLNLPVEQRARFAHKLIQSIDSDPAPATNESWASEADRRAGQILDGTVATVPGHDVFRHAFSQR